MGIKPTNLPVPTAPPPYTYPIYPPEEEEYFKESVHGTDTIPPKIPDLEYLQEENTIVSDDPSITTKYDYHTFVNHRKYQN